MNQKKPRNKMYRRKLKPSSHTTAVNQPKQPLTDDMPNEQELRSMFGNSADVVIRSFPHKREEMFPVLLLFSEGMIDASLMTQFVIPDLERKLVDAESWETMIEKLENSMEWTKIKAKEEMGKLLFTGRLILFFTNQRCMYSIDIAQIPKRQPEESNTEVAIKGAKDGFTEDLNTNIALVRKRLPTTTLQNEKFVIGNRTQTLVSMLYIEDITQPSLVQEARNRLQNLHVDALVSTGELEEALGDSSLALFPLLDYIGRPDFVVQSLLRGRFVILADGSPMAIIGPCNLFELLKSPEDSYFPYHFVIFERLLRLAGLLIAILLPGFWVALSSYNLDQLPFPLLATVTVSRFGLPLSGPMEILLMLGMFELFREAGIRLPKAVGQTIAVLGGLIIGDAAIRAGLTSPTMLVVSATTAVATFTLVNQTLSGTVSLIRLYILIWSSVLGMLGFFIGLMSVIVYLSKLESFGLPYLAPISPLKLKDVTNALIKLPWSFNKRRPEMLRTTDSTLQAKERE